jgi:hypothetical protein
MRKAKIFIASFLTILVVVMITLLFVFSRTLFEPWVELFHNNASFAYGIIFIISMYVISLKKWKWWLKVTNIFVLISVYSLMTTESIMDLLTNPSFLTGVIAFITSTIAYYATTYHFNRQRRIDEFLSSREKAEKSIKDYDGNSYVALIATILFSVFIYTVLLFVLYPLLSSDAGTRTVSILVITFVSIGIFVCLYHASSKFSILKILSVVTTLLSSVLLHQMLLQ